jgi:ArsR family transcriptional regulator, arsenate/arsenite/antimonite-responsive transcriptional repressor
LTYDIDNNLYINALEGDEALLNHDDAAGVFKALADVTRLKILTMLYADELCACKILEAFAITQPTLSYHMKILTESGLVEARKDGAWMRYSLNKERFDTLNDFLAGIGREKIMEKAKK